MNRFGEFDCICKLNSPLTWCDIIKFLAGYTFMGQYWNEIASGCYKICNNHSLCYIKILSTMEVATYQRQHFILFAIDIGTECLIMI